VLAAAQELGYRRNELARSLRPGQKSGVIGVAITNLANPYYSELALGIEDAVAERGLRILIGSTKSDPEREAQLITDFLGRQVDGLIVVPVGDPIDHLQPDALEGVPLVLASRLVDGLSVDAAILDDIAGSVAAVNHLIGLGHRRIGFLGHSGSAFTAKRRFEGYRQALAAAGLDNDPSLARHGLVNPEAAAQAMDGLLELPDPPTAVFCANNRNTIGVLQCLNRRGADGPSVRVAGFDDLEFADLLPVPLALVSNDPRNLGQQAARLLLGRLAEPEANPDIQCIEIPVTLRLTGHEREGRPWRMT
jgi:LacI family transcriptional regulator